MDKVTNIVLFSKRRVDGLKEEQGNSCFDTEVNLFNISNSII